MNKSITYLIHENNSLFNDFLLKPYSSINETNIDVILNSIWQDLADIWSLNREKASLGALALRMHVLTYLRQLDIQADGYKYYEQVAWHLTVTTQLVFDEITYGYHQDLYLAKIWHAQLLINMIFE